MDMAYFIGPQLPVNPWHGYVVSRKDPWPWRQVNGSRCPSLLNTTAHHETSSKLSDLSDPWFSFPPYQAAGSGTGEDG